ncbi:hypothetical protein [Actinoallomurus iriomotensis]|uniref:Uncharacterized protein n=1 Tax=Actinoallomurus iriomotensis TaxID=478107 RepID=A0A9W6SF04_9ACTN|nr:hypothetical protein [Actinoallomurus iriomotensis]GLY92353.1 hypothetical protein Airi02_102810 [Actinoallomurus iriomotensis]
MPEFVVEADPDAVARTRAALLRSKRGSAWSSAVGGCLILGIAIGATAIAGFGLVSLPMAGVGVAGLILVADARRQFTAVRRMRATWTAIGVPPEVLLLSPAGLRFRVDIAPEPCFLPWSKVAKVGLRGGRSLTVALAPGVTAATPGVSGLDQPEVRRALRRRELRFPLSSLRRPPEEIDRALTAFTAGRLRLG